MAITERDEELIEYGFVKAFLPDLPQNKETAEKAMVAWEQLIELMKRENNYSNQLGSSVLDWQIGNWVNDLTMLLHNAGCYNELISVNEQILQIEWKNEGDSKLFHENAMRDIADAYADMGNVGKSYELYREYLMKDPLWAWGWIGYYRQLNDHDNPEFLSVIEKLYKKIRKNEPFRDMSDLCRELLDEFETIGESDKASYLAGRYEQERRKESEKTIRLLKNKGFINEEVSGYKNVKVYPNEPCPCGSGCKYKKCCGRK